MSHRDTLISSAPRTRPLRDCRANRTVRYGATRGASCYATSRPCFRVPDATESRPTFCNFRVGVSFERGPAGPYKYNPCVVCPLGGRIRAQSSWRACCSPSFSRPASQPYVFGDGPPIAAGMPRSSQVSIAPLAESPTSSACAAFQSGPPAFATG
jgi:hypothetical protein